jgi:hypothetical protein
MSYDWHPEKFNAKLHKHIVDILTVCALMVLADAIKTCPVLTGRLRASLTYRVDAKELRAVVGTNVFYALFRFLGTYKMAGSFTLTRALEKNKPAIRRKFQGK